MLLEGPDVWEDCRPTSGRARGPSGQVTQRTPSQGTCERAAGTGGSSPPRPWKVGDRLQGATWREHHVPELSWAEDRTSPMKASRKLRLWWAGAEITGLADAPGRPRAVGSLTHHTAPCQSGVIVPFPPSPACRVWGPVYGPTARISLRSVYSVLFCWASYFAFGPDDGAE